MKSQLNISQNYDRYPGLDILKTICAFGVVCIHKNFPGNNSWMINCFARCAVPIFLMISGFFYFKTSPKKQFKKILVLAILANTLYFCWACFVRLIKHKSIVKYIFSLCTTKNIKNLLFFNVSPFGSHLWYLWAILYVLIIVNFFQHIKKIKFLYYITPILLLGDLLFGKYSMILLGKQFPVMYIRNFLFVGIPYFMIGTYLSHQAKSYNIIILKFSVIIFTLTSFFERWFIRFIDMNAKREHYLSTTFLSIAMFLLFINMYNQKKLNTFETILVRIGRYYSTGIYIVHIIIEKLFDMYIKDTSLYTIYKFIAPICIFISSLLITMGYKFIFNQIKKH